MSEENGRIAIISDIHGNLETLEMVFADIDYRNKAIEKGDRRGRKITKIWCLGDIVGYGPNPKECLELVKKRCEVVLAGNHEQATVWKMDRPDESLYIFKGTGAKEGIHWTIRQLYGDNTPVQQDKDEINKYTQELVRLTGDNYRSQEAEKLGKEIAESGIVNFLQRVKGSTLEVVLNSDKAGDKIKEFYKRVEDFQNGKTWVEYLKSLPFKHEENGVLLTHDNEENPGDMRYMLPLEHMGKPNMHVYPINNKVFQRLSEKGIKRMFFGHSHIPGIYNNDKYKDIKIVNVGSVGIPRVGEFAATYCIWNPNAPKHREFEIVEMPFDYKPTNDKMLAAGLPGKLQGAYERLKKSESVELD